MSTYDDASLIYYPSGYKAGKAYSLKPTDGIGDLTFTRASTATRVNSSGLIESVATGVPRIDYTGGGCGKLLLEPQRTNLVFPSATASTQTVTTTAQSYTLSFDGTGTVVRSGTSTGTLVGTGANDRVFVTFTATAGSLTLTITGSVTNWQLEAGAYSTSLIITTTTAVTRVVDKSSTTGLGSIIGQTEGTIYVEGIAANINADLLGINRSTTNAIFITKSNLNAFRVYVYAGGVGLTFSDPNVNTDFYKLAITYKSGNSYLYVNGVKIGATNTSAFTFSAPLNILELAGNYFIGLQEQKIQGLMIFPTAKSEAEVAALTTL